MSSIKDFSDSLAEEILTEVADGFLGERKSVEDQIHVFRSCVTRLEIKGRQVLENAALLNYLLINKRQVDVFYRDIGAAGHPFVDVEGRLADGIFIPEIPFVIRKKNKYVQTVILAYALLCTGLDEYLHGSNLPEDDPSRDGEPDVNLRMVMIMADLINEKIKKLSQGRSPTSVLQYARSFNPEMLQKERVTGAVSADYKSALDRKLAFKRIEPDRLPVERFAEIPDLRQVLKKITLSCKRIYRDNKTEIRSRLLCFKNVRSS
jgi:hypothetical protein